MKTSNTKRGWTLTSEMFEYHFNGRIIDKVRLFGTEFVYLPHKKQKK